MGATQVLCLLCLLSQVLGQNSTDRTTAPHQLIAQAANKFTFKTYNAMKEQDGNICVSPFSIEVLLAMLYLGSRGAVKNEIQAALQLPNNAYAIKEGFRDLIGRVGTSEKLKLAVKMFAADYFRIKEMFLSDAQTYFNSGIDTLNFKTSPEEAVRAINSFVAEKTYNKITNLFDELPQDTVLVLVNAIYFNATWKHEIRSSKPGKFFVGDNNSPMKVNMMSVTMNFPYKHDEDLGAQIVEIPYEGDYSMFIVLPDKNGGLQSVESKIAMSNFETIIAGLQEVGRVRLKLPMFKIEMTINVKALLRKVGITTMFEPNTDLSGITDDPISYLYVSDAIQKTYINVNKKGTEAAAATGIVVRPRILGSKTSKPVDIIVKVDHPFLFMITYKPTNTVFFKGRCLMPEVLE